MFFYSVKFWLCGFWSIFMIVKVNFVVQCFCEVKKYGFKQWSCEERCSISFVYLFFKLNSITFEIGLVLQTLRLLVLFFRIMY